LGVEESLGADGLTDEGRCRRPKKRGAEKKKEGEAAWRRDSGCKKNLTEDHGPRGPTLARNGRREKKSVRMKGT